jgi:repressor LexA
MSATQRTPYETLSEKQKMILRVIQEWLTTRGFPPTIREIGNAVGISSTSVVNYNLNKLVDGGHINRSRKFSRGITLAVEPEGDALPSNDGETVHVANLGRIAAGLPMPTFSADNDEMIAVPASLLGGHNPANLYALRINGDSMIDAMISDGDLVIFKYQQTARNGEMVAAWLPEREETTLKYFFDEGSRIRLQPANPTMEPIYLAKAEVQIQGRVLAVLRRLS